MLRQKSRSLLRTFNALLRDESHESSEFIKKKRGESRVKTERRILKKWGKLGKIWMNKKVEQF